MILIIVAKESINIYISIFMSTLAQTFTEYSVFRLYLGLLEQVSTAPGLLLSTAPGLATVRLDA